MALALESLTFSVETKELENAIQKIKELGQAASSLNKQIEQLGKQASEAGKKVEKAASASEVLAAGNAKAKTATDNLGKSQEKATSGAAKMQALIERLSNTYMDLSNGMTRGESNILNAARSFGALEAQLEPVRKVLEQIKELSKDPFDAAIGSVRRISQEFEQFRQRTDLANQGIYLSTKQLQEYSKIASEIKGKLVSSGVKEGSAEYQERFASMLAETNKQYLDYVSKLNSGLAAEQARNKALAEQERLMQAQERLLQQNATAMDEVAKRWKFMQSQKAEQERNAAIKEQNRLLAQGSVMMDGAVNKFKAGQLAKEQEKLNEQLREQNRLMQQGATAMDSAVIDFYNRKHQALQDLVKAEQFLATQEEKLQFVTAKTAEGFTVASANALYRYEQSLKKAGVTEQEFIGRSNAYATALKARQDVSDTNARRKAATEELIRIEKQLEDQEKFLAFATAEFSKQQQQATAGNQNFADSLSMGSLRALFAYEQALRRAGVAEIDVASKSEVMRKQMLQMQQATDSFNGSVNHLGRNVGVQFTDIFVSLYNGQPIMQVITQQGGQLADAFLLAGVSGQNMSQHLVEGFKKILESYKMLGAAFAGLVGTGFDKVIDTFTVSTNFLNESFKELMSTAKTANSMNEVLAVGFSRLSVVVTTTSRATALFAGTFIAMAAIEFLKADLAMEKLNKTLIQSGAALGITAQQGEELAVQIGTATTASIGSARDAILTFAKEGVDVTTEAVTKAVELNEYLGISFEESAKKAAQFKNEPVDALIEMAKKTGEVDLETLKYVASLELAGDRQGAIKAAIEAKDKAETAAINRAKVGLSGLSELWLTIKQSIVNATDETIVFLTTSKTLRSIYAGVGAIINTLLYGTAQIYEGWRAIFSVLSAAATGSIDNINASLAESARRMTGVNSDATKLYEDLYKFATADAEANNEAAEATAKRNKENSKSAGVFQKEFSLRQQLARDLGKADADKLTRQQFINASIDEEMRKLGFVTKDQEILNALTAKYGEEWDKANKKKSQRGSFSTSVGNTLVETSKQFEQRLQLEQRLTQDQLATLENYYKDGLNSKGNYLAQEVNIVTASREKQLQILEQYNDAELAAFAEKEAKLRANAVIAVAKGGDAKSIDKQLQQNLADLAMQKQTFNEKITGKQELAYSAVTKILSKSLSEVSKSTQEVTNDVEKFSLELAKQQVSRQADIQFAAETIGMSEKEIAVLKAKMQVQEQYNKLLLDTSKNIAESESTFWEFVQGIDPMNSEALDKAWAMWQGIQKAKMKLTEAGAEQELAQRIAMQDAALAHDLANYKKLKDGVADAIATALLEGGKEGKKKLRDLIVAELRKPITLVIDAVVNAGLSAIGMNPSQEGSAASFTKLADTLSSVSSAFSNKASISNSLQGSLETIGTELFYKGNTKMAMSAYDAAATVSKFSKQIDMAGDALSYFDAFKKAEQGKWGEALGQAGGTYIGGPIGGQIGATIGSLVDDVFRGDSGTPHTGGAGGYSAAKGTYRTIDNEYKFGNEWFNNAHNKTNEAIASAQNISKTIVTALDKTAITFGKTAGYEMWTGFADDASSDPAWSRLFIKNLDNVLVNLDPKFADGQEGVKQYSKFLADNVVGILDGMNLPAWTKAITKDLSAFGDALTIDQVVQAIDTINNVNSLFKKFSEAMNLSQESLLGTISAFGSVDAASQVLSAYYETFYSETEKTAFNTKQLNSEFEKLSLKMPTSNEEFRKLVEQQDKTTEAGNATFNALIALSSAFDSVTEKAAEFSNEITAWYEDILGRTPDSSGFDYWSNQVSSGLMSMEKAAEAFSEQAGMELLQRQLLELVDPQQALVEARARELSLLPESQRAIQQQIWARQEELRVIEQRTSLEEQLLQVTDNSSAIRAKERSEIYASNLALFDLVKSLEDFKALSTELEAAMNNAASAAEKVKSIQDKATSNYVQAHDKVAEAQKKIQDIQNENLKQQIEKAKELSSAFSDLSKSMKDFVYGEIKPSSQLFTETLEKALAGNQEAMKELPNAATTAIEQAKNTSGTLEEYERKRAKILASVLQVANVADSKSITSTSTATSLEAKLTPEQTAIQQAQKELADALNEQKDALKVANAISASLVVTQEDLIAEYKAAKAEQAKADSEVVSLQTQLSNLATQITALATATGNLPAALAAISINAEANIKSSITMATGSDLPTELKQIALASLNDLQSNFKVVSSNKSMPAEVKQVAMAAIASSSSNFGVIAKSTSIPAEVKQLALGTASALTSNITTVVTQAANGTIPASIAKLALGSQEGIATTITTVVKQAESGKIPESISKLVLNSANGLSTNVVANVIQSGRLDDAAKATILSATDTIAKTFNVTVQNANSSTVPAVISNLALKTNEQLAKSLDVTVALAKDTAVPTVISNLAGTSVGTLSRTISTTVTQAANGKIPQEIATLAGTTTDKIGKTLSVTLAAAQAGAFPTWVTELALNSINNAAKTVDVTINQAAANKNESWITNLKLLTSDAVSKTVQIAMGGDPTLTAAQAALKITSADNLLKTVDLALSDSKLTADEQELITSLAKNVDGTVRLEGGTGLLGELRNIFSALDSNGSKMIMTLEAIRNNVAGLATAIGTGTASQVVSSQSGMDRSKFESTLKSEAMAKNVDLNNLTTQFSSFANGVFSSLDIDSNGLLSSSEVDASKISGAVQTLLTTYTKQASSGTTSGTSTGGVSSVYTPSSSDLSAYKAKIVDERPSGSNKKYEQFVYDLYIDYARRKPEISGFNYWVNSIKDGVKSYPESAVLAQVKSSFSAATKGITKDKAFQEQYNYLIGASFSESAAKYFAGLSSYAVGGYTGPGGKYEAAGMVHRGEVVFSQDDIAKLGGVGVVEGIRTGEIPMFANGGIVQPGSPTSVQVTQQDNSELVEELKNLREEVKMLRAEARATAMNTSKTSRILDDVTQGGTEVKVAQTEEFIALFGK